MPRTYFYLGEEWEEEYSTAECIVYSSKDGLKLLYKYWDGTHQVVGAVPEFTESISPIDRDLAKIVVPAINTEQWAAIAKRFHEPYPATERQKYILWYRLIGYKPSQVAHHTTKTQFTKRR